MRRQAADSDTRRVSIDRGQMEARHTAGSELLRLSMSHAGLVAGGFQH